MLCANISATVGLGRPEKDDKILYSSGTDLASLTKNPTLNDLAQTVVKEGIHALI